MNPINANKNFLKVITNECMQVSTKRQGEQSVLMRKKSMESLADENTDMTREILEEMKDRWKFWNIHNYTHTYYIYLQPRHIKFIYIHLTILFYFNYFFCYLFENYSFTRKKVILHWNRLNFLVVWVIFK